MAGTEDARNSHRSPARTRPTEEEVTRLLQEAARQYEEYIRIANLADISDEEECFSPKYAWDNPLGFAVVEPKSGEQWRVAS